MQCRYQPIEPKHRGAFFSTDETAREPYMDKIKNLPSSEDKDATTLNKLHAEILGAKRALEQHKNRVLKNGGEEKQLELKENPFDRRRSLEIWRIWNDYKACEMNVEKLMGNFVREERRIAPVEMMALKKKFEEEEARREEEKRREEEEMKEEEKRREEQRLAPAKVTRSFSEMEIVKEAERKEEDEATKLRDRKREKPLEVIKSVKIKLSQKIGGLGGDHAE